MQADGSPVPEGRGLLLLLLLLLASCCCEVDGSQPPTKDGFGIGDYEYLYDELPREHLARFGRAADSVADSHIQHVPNDAPRGVPEDADSAIQRVPRRAEDAAAAAATAGPVSVLGSAVAARGQGEAPEAVSESATSPSVESAEKELPSQQATQVPATVPADDKLEKEDMQTANFFWGLGPVYPHLYVYRRVPHLVPLHGWSPYHAYQLTHPSK